MEPDPTNRRLDTLQGDDPYGRPVEDGVVSSSQQDQAPRRVAPPETAQAVGRQSTEHAGVEVQGVSDDRNESTPMRVARVATYGPTRIAKSGHYTITVVDSGREDSKVVQKKYELMMAMRTS